eukprot:11089215-Karenia_brevis.AAC.1
MQEDARAAQCAPVTPLRGAQRSPSSEAQAQLDAAFAASSGMDLPSFPVAPVSSVLEQANNGGESMACAAPAFPLPDP